MAEANIKTRTIVGLEVHVQLNTKTKLLCGCPVRFGALANSCVCPVCLGHPGALPVLNHAAYDYAVRAGLALNCTIATFTKWDRKSYYYPDLPKNYQISQFDLPLAANGYFDMPAGGAGKRIRIRRVHLEEDAGKNLHGVGGSTLVDLNRAGTPLLEIVTEPDIGSADEAFTFCVELQRLVTYLGISEGIMQKGHLRFEPNVNVAIEAGGREYRTPISEVKNLNSFRAVRGAVAYEARRQVEAWRSDHDYQLGTRPNENRGWSSEREVTEFQRVKEAAHDYRYFPDPDLAAVEAPQAMIESLRAALPELPVARRRRLTDAFRLSIQDAEILLEHRPTADLFEAVVEAGASANVAGKQFVNVWLKLANNRNVKVVDLAVEADRMAELAKITAEGLVNKTAANRIAEAMLRTSDPPAKLAETMGLVQMRDSDATARWVEEALAANEKAVEDAVHNPKKAKAAAGFLIGQVMRLSGGKANPKLVEKLVGQRLMQERDG